jgi:hypothetical protein
VTDVSEEFTKFVIRLPMVEAVSTSDALVSLCETTRLDIPEDKHLNTCLLENLNSHKRLWVILKYCSTVRLRILAKITINFSVDGLWPRRELESF